MIAGINMRILTHAAIALLIVGATNGRAEEPPEKRDGMPLVFADAFENGLENWKFTDDEAWKIADEDGDKVLALYRDSRYHPPVRSPRSIALVKDLNLGDFVIEVKVRQTGREYGHRDMCVFFNYEDPSHFYYTHLATKADAHANSIFLVNGEPRVSIAEERTDGTKWTEGYHTIWVKREVKSGLIEVYFDSLEAPVFVAHDEHFKSGTVGVGSFDDVGHFAHVYVWGEDAEEDDGEESDKEE